MNHPILSLFAVLLVQSAVCQSSTGAKETTYFLDINSKVVANIKNAKYLIYRVQENDASVLVEKYNFNGPIISAEYFKDEKAGTLNGTAAYYNKNGLIDSSGDFINNLKSGSWFYLNSEGVYKYQRNFLEGNLIAEIDLTKKPTVDSSQKKQIGSKTDTLVEMESTFPGDNHGWSTYLTKKLKYPERAINLNKQGQVVILFVVDKNGEISSPLIARSVEFSLDQEALRMIKESPNWIPAVQDGRPVKSYKKQPITFKLG